MPVATHELGGTQSQCYRLTDDGNAKMLQFVKQTDKKTKQKNCNSIDLKKETENSKF